MKKKDIQGVLGLLFIMGLVLLLIIAIRTIWFGISAFGVKVLLTDLVSIFALLFINHFGFSNKKQE